MSEHECQQSVARTPHQKHTPTVISRVYTVACNICPLMRSGGEYEGLDNCTVWRFQTWWKVSGGKFRVLIIPGGRFLVACLGF